MTTILHGAVSVSILLLAAIVAADLSGRSAARRHWTIAVAVVCAAALPLVAWVAPRWHLPAQPFAPASTTLTHRVIIDGRAAESEITAPPVDRSLPNDQTAAASRSAPVAAAFLGVWIGGATLALLALVAGLVRLAWLSKAATRIDAGPWKELAGEIGAAFGLRRPVTLLLSEESTLLGTWGVIRPRILLPAAARDWSRARLRIVLYHELAHVHRGDWALQLIAEALRSIYWFNPLTWIACTRLRRESEHACDDVVLGRGVPSAEYAGHLLDLARTLHAADPWLSVPAMARPSSLEGRITAMLNNSTDRTPLTRWVRLATIAGLLGLTTAIAGFGAQGFFTFSGSVVDSTNRFIANATLVVTNTASRAKHEVRSDATGRFELVGLPPGDYALEVSRPGFSPFTDTFVVAGRNLERVVELHVGSLEETIRVVGGASPSSDQRPRRQTLAPERIDQLRAAARARCEGGVGPAGGAIVPPFKVVSVSPVYPEALRIAKVGGVVTADAVIGLDGSIQEVRNVVSPEPELEAAALEAVRQWQFSPTLLNCTPTEVHMRVTVRFSAEP